MVFCGYWGSFKRHYYNFWTGSIVHWFPQSPPPSSYCFYLAKTSWLLPRPSFYSGCPSGYPNLEPCTSAHWDCLTWQKYCCSFEAFFVGSWLDCASWLFPSDLCPGCSRSYSPFNQYSYLTHVTDPSEYPSSKTPGSTQILQATCSWQGIHFFGSREVL